MTVSLYVIGTEITRGIISDRHIQFLSSNLTELGYTIRRAVVVPDDGSIEAELEVCAADSDIVLVTGGLGPTADDLTRRIIAREAGVPLVRNQEAWDTLYKRVGERIHGANEQQAYIPQGFELLPNPNGTAPGFRGSFEKKCPDGSVHCVTVIAMPGPPAELQPMFLNHVRPYLAKLAGHVEEQRDEYSVYLIAEARLDELCRQCAAECNLVNISWGTRFQQFRISLYVQGGSASERALFISKLRSMVGEGLIEDADDTDACTLLTNYLIENNLTISTAESCTAGLVSKMLTDRSGSSSYFWGGAVTYANSAKQKIAGVCASTLENFGAVSRQTACEMADGIRQVSGTDLAVSLTGIAGPDGGSAEKPVGTVWIGFSSARAPSAAVCLKFASISRDSARRRFSIAALVLCRLYAMGRDVVTVAETWKYI